MSRNLFIFRNRLLWHVLFWVFVYLFYVITYGEYQDNYRGELITNLLLLPLRMLGVYSLIYYLLPQFLLKKRYFAFFGLCAIHALVYGWLIWSSIYFIEIAPSTTQPLLDLGQLLTTILVNYIIATMAVIIKLFKTWYIDQSKKQQLLNEKHQAELNFLKTQIHPHFLFNTLNNLYSLTLIKSDEAPNVVIKLSQLLNYTLYDCNVDYVNFNKEMEFIENYMSLQKIRHNADIVSIKLDIDANNLNQNIAPLLLLPIIENCFKHGVDKSEDEAYINVRIKSYETHLDFYAENSIPEADKNKVHNDGIGISNIKKRLELLYKNAYKLEIKKENLTFKLSLKLYWNPIIR
ncbi:sensor histidine kinase [Carboxylicivirga sp. N1Y90]|uniref:sensor histidine kinase n=1 Tax=Carboxylicivirga fragile TaxID=3417571 RepID=UPI003D32E9EE|nr:histidine kinase [Marinilabiliaceae bacterium N1Y90]